MCPARSKQYDRSADSENGVIQFENVGLRYGLGPEILRDLSFKITPHSFQFLSGPSGAGKTSLLRLLFLSMRPTRGLITLFDHDTATLSKDSLAVLRRRIGIVFQDFRLLDHLTTFDNVALPLKVLGRKEESYYDEVTELLGWVGLGDRMWSLPPVLSGGEKQRAAIARAVIARPQILLAELAEEYVFAELCEALTLSLAAENEARMRAMTAAKSNVGKMLDDLIALSRQLRQEEITNEIIELGGRKARAYERGDKG